MEDKREKYDFAIDRNVARIADNTAKIAKDADGDTVEREPYESAIDRNLAKIADNTYAIAQSDGSGGGEGDDRWKNSRIRAFIERLSSVNGGGFSFSLDRGDGTETKSGIMPLKTINGEGLVGAGDINISGTGYDPTIINGSLTFETDGMLVHAESNTGEGDTKKRTVSFRVNLSKDAGNSAKSGTDGGLFVQASSGAWVPETRRITVNAIWLKGGGVLSGDVAIDFNDDTIAKIQKGIDAYNALYESPAENGQALVAIVSSEKEVRDIKFISLGKMALKNEVAVSDIKAAGTPSENTFLRGDDTWAAIPSSTPNSLVKFVVANDAVFERFDDLKINITKTEVSIDAATDGTIYLGEVFVDNAKDNTQTRKIITTGSDTVIGASGSGAFNPFLTPYINIIFDIFKCTKTGGNMKHYKIMVSRWGGSVTSDKPELKNPVIANKTALYCMAY